MFELIAFDADDTLWHNGTLFQATAQATEAAITNALLAAETTTGANDLRIYAMPVDRMLAAMRGGSFLAHDFMTRSRVRGAADWQRYSIELKLPPATTRLELGAMLEGAGTLWVDDFELDTVEP